MHKDIEVKPRVLDAQVSRRKFLAGGIGAIAGLIGAALGIPVVGYAISPALAKKEQNWVEIGSVNDFQPLQPTKVEYDVFRRDGWIDEQIKKTAWLVMSRGGESAVVYDPRCTHLGCAYRWEAKDKLFLCPCHDGKFDLDGAVIGGPPPRPLDRLKAKIEGGKILVLEG